MTVQDGVLGYSFHAAWAGAQPGKGVMAQYHQEKSGSIGNRRLSSTCSATARAAGVSDSTHPPS